MTSHQYAFLTVFLWSTSYIATNVIMNTFTAGPLALLRCIVATVILVTAMRVKRIPFPAKCEFPHFLLTGLLGLSLYTVLFNNGTKLLNPTTSCIIIATVPVIVALLARFILGERLAIAGWVAIGMAFAGVIVINLWDGSMEANEGILRAGAAAVLLALFNIVQRKLSARLLSLQIITMSFLAASLELCWFIPELASQIRYAPTEHTLTAIYMGIFPSGLGYLLWIKAIAIADRTSQVTNYMFLMPFLSLLLELLFLRQLPSIGTIVGGLFILSGLMIFTFAGKAK